MSGVLSGPLFSLCFLLSLFDPLEVPFLGNLPLFIVFLIALLVVFVVWKVIKFAVKLLLVLAVFFVILIGLDFLGVFSWLQNLFSHLL
jgi:hypothetical protein